MLQLTFFICHKRFAVHNLLEIFIQTTICWAEIEVKTGEMLVGRDSSFRQLLFQCVTRWIHLRIAAKDTRQINLLQTALKKLGVVRVDV